MNARLEQAVIKLRHARARAAFFRLGKVAMLIDDALRLVEAELVEQELVGLELDLDTVPPDDDRGWGYRQVPVCYAHGCERFATLGRYCGLHVDDGDELAAVLRDLLEDAPRRRQPKMKGKWTYDAALAAIREVGAKVGRTPTHADMKAAGYATVPATPTLRRLGASWPELVAAAGFEPRLRCSA